MPIACGSSILLASSVASAMSLAVRLRAGLPWQDECTASHASASEIRNGSPAKSQDQTSGLEVGALNHVDHAAAHGNGSGSVDPSEIQGANVAKLPFLESQTSKPERDALGEQHLKRMPGRGGLAESHLTQDVAERREAFVDVPADEVMMTRPAFELERKVGVGPRRELLIHLGRLGASARVGKRVTHRDSELELFLGRCVDGGGDGQGSAKELDRSFKRESARGVSRGLDVIFPGGAWVSRGVEVNRQRLGVGLARRLELLGERLIVFAELLRSQVIQYRFTNAIVIGFDVVERSWANSSDQPAGS